MQVYGKAAEGLEEEKIERVKKFIASILAASKSRTIEYWLLTCLRHEEGDIKKFQQSFYLDERSLETLLKRWKQFFSIERDRVTLTAKDIGSYLKKLPAEESPDYAKHLAYSGKQKSKASS